MTCAVLLALAVIGVLVAVRPTHARSTRHSDGGGGHTTFTGEAVPKTTVARKVLSTELGSTAPSSLPAPRTPRPVTSVVVSIVDTTRPVIRDGIRVVPTRQLPTTVWVPDGADRLPLVVFAHGFRLGPSDYARFCSTLAAAGFVVAAPSFPLADLTRGLGLDRGDIPEEATDVSRVIDALDGGTVDASVTRRIRPGDDAVVGHSDGADVALLDGYGSGHVDRRLRAVVSIAPDAMTGGIVESDVPLLLVQGNADTIVPYGNGQKVFTQVQAPRGFLTLLGADHLPPIAGNTKWTPVLDFTVASFLHAAIRGTPSAEHADQAFTAVRNELGSGSPARFATH